MLGKHQKLDRYQPGAPNDLFDQWLSRQILNLKNRDRNPDRSPNNAHVAQLDRATIS